MLALQRREVIFSIIEGLEGKFKGVLAPQKKRFSGKEQHPLSAAKNAQAKRKVNKSSSKPGAGMKKGRIVISNVTEPYGASTADIVSIAIALNGEDVQWKAHIPYENIDGLIEALNKAKNLKK